MRLPKKNLSQKIILKLKEHIQDNIREYLIISIIFLIGIVLGVIFINNVDESKEEQINTYINSFVNDLKGDYKIDLNNLLHKTLINSLSLVFIIWIVSMIAVIGVPIVCIIIMFRGFILGYTISCIAITLGDFKGTLFSVSSLLIHNLIFIPCIIALGVSSIKLYKSIVNNKKKENVKLEIIKHTIFSGMLCVGVIISCFLETYISGNLTSFIINYI